MLNHGDFRHEICAVLCDGQSGMALVLPSFWRVTLLVVLFQCTLCAHVNIQIFMIDRGAIHHEIYFIPIDEPTDVASIGMHIWHLINNTYVSKLAKSLFNF